MDDLRVEVAAERDEDAKDGITGRLEDGDVERWLSDIGDDWRRAELAAADRTMLEFVERLTLRPGDVRRIDVDALREVGFGDTGIHDVVQVVALFSYFNRLADGLGADDEPEWSSQ